ncbi:efflux RND transporter periplasmic adaptor subunit [Caulobacter sp. 17J65-9]|uniref:efflux RND transporter periplasmic adaptor subunit n=1 Tax=Caulobacter sp. 17J65-9 TaxID=2709382 RepID=UPI0013C6C2AA|nr:efflux RND transporter periplasmic adaptor subunit [Caulobacter sp. 17J65-9]NEX93566.1 HlyD family efflux transporter periplasmic adaptor subunit [Caulobacter sp. 17J65-9]
MTASSPAPRFARRIDRRLLWLGGLAVLILIVLFASLGLGRKSDAAPYRTEAVARGDLTRTVSASGSLEALVTVQVGSQLSGQVEQVLVDFNDRVKRGQTLAILDPSTYQSRLAQGRAEVKAADAQVAQQRAALAQAQADVAVAQAAYNRTKALADKGIAAQAALDQADAELKRARAAVGSAQAAIGAQAARVNQSQAALDATRVDLERTRVVAPIDGIVVDRQIEPGQTVAASLQAPTLFVLAQDLSRVQAKILVDEADIGQVREGQPVRFTVDAYPDESFRGVVTQVRKQPQTEQNVVAYVVLAQADNPNGKLLPGMTANADIIIERRSDVMKVPTTALRFTPADAQGGRNARQGGLLPMGGPPADRNPRGGGMNADRIAEALDLDAKQKAQIAPILTEARSKAQAASGGERRTAMREAMNAAFDKIRPLLRPDQVEKLEALRSRTASGGQRGVVWVLRDGEPVAVPVRIGGSDGTSTEVLGGQLKVGDQVITGGGPRPKAQAALRGGRGGGPGGPGGPPPM